MSDDKLRARYEKEMAMREKYEAAMALRDQQDKSTGSNNDVLREVTQEMHPDISAWDRIVAKNLSQSEGATEAYLKKKYPNLEVANINGQIALRSPKENSYRALDPSPGWDLETLKDIPQDIADIGYDVVSGVAQKAATTAGTGAGLFMGGPGGALAGGMGASGTSGAGLEALRQWAGKQAGIPQDVDPVDVGIAGAIGALDPFMFGSEKAAKKLAGTYAGEGALRRGTAKAAEIFTGVQAPVWLRASADPARMKAIQEMGEDNFAEESLGGLRQSINNKLDNFGQEIQRTVRDSGELIDISRSRKIVQDRIAEVEKLTNKTQKDLDYLKQLKDLQKSSFTTKTAQTSIEMIPTGQIDEITGQPIMQSVPTVKQVKTPIPDIVDAETAYRVRDTIDDVVDYKKDKYAKEGLDKRLEGMAKNSSGDIRNQLNQIPGAEDAYKNYRQAKTDLDYMKSFLQNKKNAVADGAEDQMMYMHNKKGEVFMKRAGSGTDTDGLDALRRLDKRYGTNVVEESQELSASRLWKDAGFTPKSLNGATSTSQSYLSDKFGKAAGAALGMYAGREAGGEGYGTYGTAAGGLAGLFLTSPIAFKRAMQMSMAPNLIRPEIRKTAWNMMQTENGQ